MSNSIRENFAKAQAAYAIAEKARKQRQRVIDGIVLVGLIAFASISAYWIYR